MSLNNTFNDMPHKCLLFLFCDSFLWQNGKTRWYFLSYSVDSCTNQVYHCCISPQESTRVSTVSSRRAMCVAATSNTAASFTTRRASASTPSLCSTTRASAVRSTPASAAITAPVPSTRPPKVRLCNTTCVSFWLWRHFTVSAVTWVHPGLIKSTRC